MTKRQASKRYRQEMVRRLQRLDRQPPEATFDNAEDMMKWLDDPNGEIERKETT